jgi:hypothetical protein
MRFWYPLIFGCFQYALHTDPSSWGGDSNVQEQDDHLHNPDPRRDRKNDAGGHIFTARGMANLGCLAILFFGLVILLYVCFPPSRAKC